MTCDHENEWFCDAPASAAKREISKSRSFGFRNRACSGESQR